MSGDDNMIPLGAGSDTHLEALAQQFRGWLDNRSPSTQSTYATGLSRFREYLIERGELAGWHPSLLTPEVVARFRAWLLRRHGPERQATVSTYLAGLLAFARFLSVRNLLNHTNPGPIIGNITSPLFGFANQIAGAQNGEGFYETANNRRLEMQIRFAF